MINDYGVAELGWLGTRLAQNALNYINMLNMLRIY